MWGSVYLLVASLATGTQAVSVYDLISHNPDLSEFLKLLNADVLFSKILQQNESTVFVPTNAAVQKYTGEHSASLLQYHVLSVAMSPDQLTLERFVPTRLKGGHPVFVSAPRPGHVFINNARILTSDVGASSENQQDQVLHIIDEVLEPTVAAEAMYSNPNALQLLTNSDQHDLGGFSIEKFHQKVEAEGKMDIFNSESFHTYLIPIDKDFDESRGRFTDQVIDGHVIPNHALFTRTMGDESYRTLAFNDMLKVTIKLRSERLPVFRYTSEPSDPVDPPTAPDGGQPTFEPNASQNVTVLRGRTAYLRCPVHSSGHRPVVWLRMRDWPLMDDRFSVLGAPRRSYWTLQVKFVQHRDAGTYTCYIATSPTTSYTAHLTVVDEAQSTIQPGNIALHAGSVLSKVVKPNIIVKNGVVHLIEKPLMVAHDDVISMIVEGQGGRFHEFYKLMMRDDEFVVHLMTSECFTIFIPTNEAFYNTNQRSLQGIVDSPVKLHELLKLHMVSSNVTTGSVQKSAKEQPYSVPSDAPFRSLYLSVTGDDGLERTLTVEGGGTNATIIVPDVICSNGVIHIIDHVLGIPYQTVAERPAMDPPARSRAVVRGSPWPGQGPRQKDRVPDQVRVHGRGVVCV